MQWLGERLVGLLVVGAIVGVIALGMAVVNYFTPNVWIYADNTTNAPMTVQIEEQSPVTIAPGQVEIIKLFAGEKKIEVLQDGKSIYSATASLASGGPRKYLLNPGEKGRYGKHSVVYGSNLFAGGFDTNSVDGAFRALAAEIRPLPVSAWHDLESCDHVFETAPAQIEVSEHTTTTTRTELIRIAEADHAIILAAQSKSNISPADIEALAQAVERTLGE
jgi:hypothetical protein